MGDKRQTANWQKTFKKWYMGFAFVGLAFTVIFRIVDGFGFSWGEIMERVFWVYFDVAFLLAFILLGIFIFWPRKTKSNNSAKSIVLPSAKLGNLEKELKSISKILRGIKIDLNKLAKRVKIIENARAKKSRKA